MQNKKHNTIECNKKTSRENKLAVTSGEMEGREAIQGHGFIIQHREYSQHFTKTVNGAQPLKIVNHYIAHL